MSDRDNLEEILSLNAKAMRKEIAAAIETLDNRELLRRLESLSRNAGFFSHSDLWGFPLYQRDREFFGPFLARAVRLAHWEIDPKKVGDWVAAAEAAGDVPLVRALIEVELRKSTWDNQQLRWEKRLRERYRTSPDSSHRRKVLEMHSPRWWNTTSELAADLYEVDGPPVVDFVIEFLDKLDQWEEVPDHTPLLSRMKKADDPRYFELFRRSVDEKNWQQEALAACEKHSGEALLDALREMHPTVRAVPGPAATFSWLLEKGGESVRPYLAEAVRMYGEEQHGDWEALADELASRRWWSEWSDVLRRNVSVSYFNKVVESIASDAALSSATATARLLMITGAGNRRWDGEIVVHRIWPQTARVLYERFPLLATSAFRSHFQIVAWGDQPPEELYSETAKAALAADDLAFFDFLASRLFGVRLRWIWNREVVIDPNGFFVNHYRAFAGAELARRGARVLSMIDFEAVDWSEHRKRNALAQLFATNPALYAEAPEAILELLESPELAVRSLGFEALSVDAETTTARAKEHLHHLLAAPMEELSREGHRAAFSALERVASADLLLAPVIVGRLRDMARLYAPPFSRRHLLETIARLLSKNEALRKPTEERRVFAYQPKRSTERTTSW